jgi:hypothetical protein
MLLRCWDDGAVVAATTKGLAIRGNISYIPVMTKEVVVMAVADSRAFRSGNSEVVRLPRNVAFGREVEGDYRSVW